MRREFIRILALLVCLLLVFEQSGFAQVVGQLDFAGHISGLHNSFTQDKFRPLHLRYLSYNNINNNFELLLDKGDAKEFKARVIEDTTKELLSYFFVGITLPNNSFWVNLRPDSPDNIIDPALAMTDVGKILLEADLQLKKDTAKFTSPETPEGKKYWDKLYQKADELFGTSNVTIPTLTRPWIVPGEIIIRETESNAYIYKATLKVCLEEDYLKDSSTYNFKDERLKQLNEYSSQLIRELIIPKLTKEVNNAKRYAPLRQVYYSLILAQWFKQKFYGKGGLYSWLIDKQNLVGLTSKISWSKTTYFKAYQQSFKDGEYNIQEPVSSIYGRGIRTYFSGGIVFDLNTISLAITITKGIVIGNPNKRELSWNSNHIIGIKVEGGNLENPSEIKAAMETESQPADFLRKQDQLKQLATELRLTKTDLPTDSSLAMQGIEAFDQLIQRLPRKLASKLLKNEDFREILTVYTGVTPESGLTFKRSVPGEQVIFIDVNEAEKEVLINTIKMDNTFEVLRIGDDSCSIVNIEAVLRVINANPEYFPAELRDQKQLTREYLKEFFSSTEKSNKNREIIYGLLSGFPKNAVEKFIVRDTAQKKVRYELRFQTGLTWEEEDELLNGRLTQQGLLSPERKRAIFEEKIANLLTEEEKNVLVSAHFIYNSVLQFVGFDDGDDLWATELEQIYKNAMMEGKNKKLFSWIAPDTTFGKNLPADFSIDLTAKTTEIENKNTKSNTGNKSLNDIGGIDFRSMSIVNQSVTALGVNPNNVSLARPLTNINLDTEWQQIQDMIQKGIIPSTQRIKEYLMSCYRDEEFAKEDKILVYIADILRLEEERCLSTDSALKELLVLLESDKQTIKQELQQ